MAKLTTIEGIGDALAAKFKKAGVGSTDALLKKGADKKGRAAIADAAKIDEKKVLRFVNHADLMRIKGIGGEFSELLEAAGVDSVPELKQRNAANLHKAMVETNAKKKLVRVVPSEKRIQGFIDQAKALPKVVTH